MTTTRLVRTSHIAALVAGVAWSLLGILSLVTPDPERYLDVLMLVTLAVTVPAVTGVYVVQRAQIGQFGRITFPLTLGGLVAMLAGMVAHLAGAEMMRDLLSIAGMAGWVIGLLLFGIATARARVLPIWAGVALALSQPLTVLTGAALAPVSPLSNFGDYAGAIANGIIWLAVGAALRSRATVSTRRSAVTAS